MSELTAKRKSKKWIIFAVSGILFIVLSILAVFFVSNAVKKNRFNNELNIAAKYYDDLEYEEAIVHYLNAIEINHYNLDAYIGIYDAYSALAQLAIAENDYEHAAEYYSAAIDILKESREYFQSDEVDDMIDDLRESKKEVSQNQNVNNEETPDTSAITEGNTENETCSDEEDDELGRLLLKYGHPTSAKYFTSDNTLFREDVFDADGNILVSFDYTMHGIDFADVCYYNYDDGRVVSSYAFYPMGSASIKEDYIYRYTINTNKEKQLDKYIFLKASDEYVYADEHATYYYNDNGELITSIYTTYHSNGTETEAVNNFLHGYLISYTIADYNGAGNHGVMYFHNLEYQEYDGPDGHGLLRIDYDETGSILGDYVIYYYD